jgi:signal transduction histidine kinase
MSGVVAVDDTGVVILANRAALSVLEVAQAESVGSSIRSFFGEAPELFAIFKAMARSQKGSERRLELTYTTPSGRKVDLGMAVISVDNTGLSGQFPRLTLPLDDRPVPETVEPSRSSLRFLLVFRDLSVKHQSALEMRRVWALAAVGEMAAGFAHEIRNPVAAIRSLCDLLLADTPEGDARREYVTRIEALLVRMERLVRTSLRFAQPTAPTRRACDPRAIVEEALEVLSPRWRGSGGRPAVVAPERLPSLRVDPDQIVEVLVALLENASDVAESPDRIAIRVGPSGQGDVLPEGAFLALEVVDDGPGIPADVQAQVFDPFYTTKPKGTGLGLSIAQRLVRQNEGHLRLFSQPGETRFRILLPIDSPPPETP